MIKAVVRQEGSTHSFLLIGLSEENVRRLRDGQPIKFAGEEVGLPDWTIAIAHGETEQSLMAELRANGFPLPPPSSVSEGGPRA